MAKYVYNGPVTSYGKHLCNWSGETIAETEKKAKSNLTYQFKKENGLLARFGNIKLPGKLEIEE